MKDLKIQLEAYSSNIIVWAILICTMVLMIANIVTIYNIYQIIDSMWVEIEHIKETNIGLFQFIEAHKDDFN
jgi:hypothetical protein